MPDRDPLQTLWTQQTQETFSMSLADIHAHSRRFQSRIRTRNLTEYAAAALVVAVFGWMAFLIPDLVVKAGCASGRHWRRCRAGIWHLSCRACFSLSAACHLRPIVVCP